MEDDYERNFIQDFIQDFSQDVQDTRDHVQRAVHQDTAEQNPVHQCLIERNSVGQGLARWNPAELSSIERNLVQQKPIHQRPVQQKPVQQRSIQQEPVQQNAAVQSHAAWHSGRRKPAQQSSAPRKRGQNEFIYHLIQEALKARETAYAPYSHYTVGAALLTAGGVIYTGGNIENASYGASNCAERTAIFKAVSEGKKHFLAIAVAGGMEGAEPVDYAYPCGICRQVMQEFAGKDFLVIVAKSTEDFRKLRLEDLLPHGFGGESIR